MTGCNWLAGLNVFWNENKYTWEKIHTTCIIPDFSKLDHTAKWRIHRGGGRPLLSHIFSVSRLSRINGMCAFTIDDDVVATLSNPLQNCLICHWYSLLVHKAARRVTVEQKRFWLERKTSKHEHVNYSVWSSNICVIRAKSDVAVNSIRRSAGQADMRVTWEPQQFGCAAAVRWPPAAENAPPSATDLRVRPSPLSSYTALGSVVFGGWLVENINDAQVPCGQRLRCGGAGLQSQPRIRCSVACTVGGRSDGKCRNCHIIAVRCGQPASLAR